MDFHKPDHVFKCIPPVLDILTRYEEYKAAKAAGEKVKEVKPVIVGLKVIPREKQQEDFRREYKTRSECATDEAQRIVEGFTKERIREHVVSIENLTIEGEEITDYDKLCELAPPELGAWIDKVVYSYYVLSRAEIKN